MSSSLGADQFDVVEIFLVSATATVELVVVQLPTTKKNGL
jgi:hypothetical protein